MPIRLAPLLCTMFLPIFCGRALAMPPIGEQSPSIQPEEPRKELSPDAAKVFRDNNQFAFDLYAKLRTAGSGNLFFSPTSISTALAMTYAGAKGQTANEMAKVLHFDLPPARLHPAFAELLGSLQSEQTGCRLSVANRLWGQKGYNFQPAFLQLTRTQYGAELAQLDFVYQPEEARQAINSWTSKQTNDKIKDLIPAGALDAMTRLVLTNAIYFKGDWTSKFDEKATQEGPFHVSVDKKVNVPLMHQRHDFRCGVAKGLQILEMPYAGKNLSMLILLPEKVDGLAGLEQQLTAENLDKWNTTLGSRPVDVFLPKFRMTSEFQLQGTLRAMGMTVAFDPAKADFTGIGGTPNDSLYISAAIHKAFVDVNEQGSEAAAATGIMVRSHAVRVPLPPVLFRADHPFVFLIRDNTTGGILFAGRVMEPKDH